MPYRMGLGHIKAVPTPPPYKHALRSGYTLHIKWYQCLVCLIARNDEPVFPARQG
jgi:hypothetical protein